MKASAILTADIELRAYVPLCRTDDHWKTQERKIKWLRELQEKHDNCPILDAGDLFDKKYKVNPSHELLGWAIENLPRPFYTVPGNHDLPGKSIENYQNSAMAVLERAGILRIPFAFSVFEKVIWMNAESFYIYGFPWGVKIEQPSFFHDKNVALIHAMVYKDSPPFPGCEGYSAKELMNLLPDFDLIVSGHNHQTFTHKIGNRILVNPGSLMRNDADQIDHKPSVFLWYAETNEIEQVFVPIRKGVISRGHIEEANARETRLDAFVEKLGDTVEHGIDFLKNLETATDNKEIPQPVKDKVWGYVEQK